MLAGTVKSFFVSLQTFCLIAVAMPSLGVSVEEAPCTAVAEIEQDTEIVVGS